MVWESAGFLIDSILKKWLKRLLQTAIFKCLTTAAFLSISDREPRGHRQDGALAHSLLFELHSLIMSVCAMEIARGLQAHPTFPHTIYDLYLWGFSKSHFYVGKPSTLWQLQTATRESFQEIGEEATVKVEAKFRKYMITIICHK